MKSAVRVTRDLVLIGGGHSHVQVLRALAMEPLEGVRVTVVSRELHTPYSGMLPGLVAGHYAFDDAHIDLGPLAQRAGARLIPAEVTGLSLDTRRIHCHGRPDLRYDVLSINSGGAPDVGRIASAHGVVPVKPISRFLPAWYALLAELESGQLGDSPRLALIGGGAGGVELTLAVSHRLAAKRLDCRVTLVTAGRDILEDHTPAVRRHLRARLAERGVDVHCGFMAQSFIDSNLVAESGARVGADRVLLVTGVEAPAWPRASGLATDDRGFIRVDKYLRSVSHEEVFVAGDVAALDGQARPKSGVYAVREGPYLTENLRRHLMGRPMRRFRAQRGALAIISEGDGRATASRGLLHAHGAWVWRLKKRIDERFMARFDMADSGGTMTLDTDPLQATSEAMRCGGCGSKLAADLLTRVLQRLDVPLRPELKSGIGDDAAILDTRASIAATVDGFRAMIDDPYRLGRIAAHHALSDVFAMGGSPTAALALVTVPLMGDELMEDELFQVMSGACDVLRVEGVALAGGHSSEGTELAVSFAVIGDAPETPWSKRDLSDGDVLILTKALGTGVVLAGQMRGLALSRDVEAAIASMDCSNGRASKVFAQYGVRASTDVTGFGLLGHLSEMLRASGTGAQVDGTAVPALPGALDLLARGVESTLAPSNALAAADFEIIGCSPTDPRVRLLTDPQTSGGLLAAVPPAQSQACLRDLRAVGCQAMIVGSVSTALDAGKGRIVFAA